MDGAGQAPWTPSVLSIGWPEETRYYPDLLRRVGLVSGAAEPLQALSVRLGLDRAGTLLLRRPPPADPETPRGAKLHVEVLDQDERLLSEVWTDGAQAVTWRERLAEILPHQGRLYGPDQDFRADVTAFRVSTPRDPVACRFGFFHVDRVSTDYYVPSGAECFALFDPVGRLELLRSIWVWKREGEDILRRGFEDRMMQSDGKYLLSARKMQDELLLFFDLHHKEFARFRPHRNLVPGHESRLGSFYTGEPGLLLPPLFWQVWTMVRNSLVRRHNASVEARKADAAPA